MNIRSAFDNEPVMYYRTYYKEVLELINSEQVVSVGKRSSVLSKKQKKARAAAKQARKARKQNR